MLWLWEGVGCSPAFLESYVLRRVPWVLLVVGVGLPVWWLVCWRVRWRLTCRCRRVRGVVGWCGAGPVGRIPVRLPVGVRFAVGVGWFGVGRFAVVACGGS